MPEQPRIGSLLGKLPACAPQLAALLRAGLVTLQEPTTAADARSSELPAPTLAPPPSRLSILPVQPASLPPRLSDLETQLPQATDPDGARLRPGGGGGGATEAIPKVRATRFPKQHAQALSDPLHEVESELQECTEPAERSRLFAQLAELWEQRIGSLEEAARYYREAASSSPDDHAAQLRAAHACARAGHGELALRYTAACLAPDAGAGATLRAQTQRLTAELYSRLGQTESVERVLREAAQEHTQASWPLLLLAASAHEQDDLAQAAQHTGSAAALERACGESERALALYALAYGWEPADPRLAVEYGDMLLQRQHPAAAIAVMTQTARSLEGAARSRLLREAARRAQAHCRHNLAAELWAVVIARDVQDAQDDGADTEAFDGLLACLPGAGGAAQRAAILESVLRPLSRRGRSQPLAQALRGASEALRELPAHAVTAAHYDALAQAPPQPEAWFEQCQQQTAQLHTILTQSMTGSERAQRFAELAGVRAAAGDWDAVASTCLAQLDLVPEDALASARLQAATRHGLADPELQRQALERLTETLAEPAPAWLMLGEQLDHEADSAGALACAQSALEHDPDAAAAALLALRHLQSVPPELAAPLIQQVRRLLASPPAVLFAIAQLDRDEAGSGRRREALTTLIELLPQFVLPRLVLLESDLEADAPEQTEADARALLLHAGVTPISSQLQRTIHALADRGHYAAAARLAEQWLETSPQPNPEFADHAYELAQISGEGALQRRALERIASTRGGAERARCLFQLALRHKAAGDRVAELRALLRAAALPQARPQALQQLGLRLAELGDLPRLLMVLSMRLSLATSAKERRSLLFEMACASVHFANDRERAANYLRSYIEECHGERKALLFCLGALFAIGDPAWAFDTGRILALEQPAEIGAALLLWLAQKAEAGAASLETAWSLASQGATHFPASAELLLLAERLALMRQDQPGALALYQALIADAWGTHGKRALHYRAGRWLERSGDPAAALAQYQLAFDVSPTQGVVYAALSRCAHGTHQPEQQLAALHRLIQQPRNERQRVELYSQAVELCAQDCQDPRKALFLLCEAEASVPLGALDAHTLEIAAQLDPADDEGSIALHELLRMRAERIEQLWEPEAKAEALFHLALLQERACHDPGAAARTLQPLVTGPFAAAVSPAKREQASTQHARLTRSVA